MAFDDLPRQPPINPRADAYALKALELSESAARKSRSLLDIAYGPDYWQRLDIYLPDDLMAAGLPVLINLHGGGWRSGYKEWMGFGAPAITSLPAIFVSMSYRLAPTHLYPVPLEDCFRGVQWVHKNIAKLGGDPDRIFVGGHSAGAHLAAMLALHHDMAARFDLPRNVIKACFPFSGPYDFTYKATTDKGEGAVKSALEFIGKGADPAAASPITYVKGNTTPFFVSWATGDNELCKTTSLTFVEALRKQTGRVGSHEFKDFDHFMIHLDQQHPDNHWVKTVRAWMSQH